MDEETETYMDEVTCLSPKDGQQLKLKALTDPRTLPLAASSMHLEHTFRA